MIDAFSKICVCVCVDVVYGSMCPKRFKDFRESKFCFFWEIKKRKYKSTKTNDGKKTDIVCLFAALNKTENTIWNHENKIKWYKWIGQICPGLTRLISDMRKSSKVSNEKTVQQDLLREKNTIWNKLSQEQKYQSLYKIP